MIDLVYEHGLYYSKKYPGKTLEELTVLSWIQRHSKKNKEKNILIIDIKLKNVVDIKIVEYNPSYIIKSGFFINKGNTPVGSGFCVPSDIKKITKRKIEKIFEDCGIDISNSVVNNIIKKILSYGKDLNNIFCVLFTYDGKYFIEKLGEIDNNSYNDKVLKVYRTNPFMRKKIRVKKNFCCQFCGCNNQEKLFDKIGWEFCTNDCNIFGHNDGIGTCIICYDCLISLMHGKIKIMENHCINWQGENVIIIPHKINEKIEKKYSKKPSKLDGELADTFLKRIRLHEKDVIRAIGEDNSFIDIIFTKLIKGNMAISGTIPGILPSRFSSMAQALDECFTTKSVWFSSYGTGKYGIKIYNVVKLFSIPPTMTKKEYRNQKIMTIRKMFMKQKFSFDDFCQKAVGWCYRKAYENKKVSYERYFCDYIVMLNFLNKIGCLLDGDINMLKNYNSYEDAVSENLNLFKTDMRKAWFLLGILYKETIYQEKKYYNKKKGERSSLESNYMLRSTFDYNFLLQIRNLLKEKLVGYNALYPSYKKIFTDIMSYIDDREYIDSFTAKFLFDCGLILYLNKEKNIESE